MTITKEIKYSHNTILILSAIFWGGLYSFYLLGNHINFTNISWLFNKEDVAQAMIGWQYFRNDSWYWPLTHTQYLAYPTGAEISYTDSIPIFAFFLNYFLRSCLKIFSILG